MSTIPTALNPTSLSAAQANQLAASQSMVANLNANLLTIFNSEWNDAVINNNAGAPAASIYWPPVPLAYVVGPPDAQGFQSPVLGTQPVCPTPLKPVSPNKPPLVPNTIDVGALITGKWYVCGNDDTMPPGFITPPIPDSSGVPHTYEKYSAGVGAGWYLQVS